MAAYNFVASPESELSFELVKRRPRAARSEGLPQREVIIHETAIGLLSVTDPTEVEWDALMQTHAVRSPDFRADEIVVLRGLERNNVVTCPARLERVGTVALQGRDLLMPAETALPEPKIFSLHTGLRLAADFSAPFLDPETSAPFIEATDRLQQEIADIVVPGLLAVHSLDAACVNRWLAEQR